MLMSFRKGQFLDEEGRILQLRGINLGGNCKTPSSSGRFLEDSADFYQHRKVSFVGKPLPMREADEHFRRIKSWGLDFLRFIVTWEAIEHEGPGIYDEDYLEYVYELIKKAGEHGLFIYIALHQNAWSRFSGGAGAPGWTFESAGMDIGNFEDTEAALLCRDKGEHYPPMIWRTNYTKLAAATMFTLFFGGNHFAPRLKVDGEPIQDFLQSHFTGAVKKLAETVRKLPNVIGYDLFSELSPGYIGWPDLQKHHKLQKQGRAPTPFQSMVLGEGHMQTIKSWGKNTRGLNIRKQEKVDPQRKRAWLKGVSCIWQEHGVWELDMSDEPKILKPDYFSEKKGRKADFANQYLKPFILNVSREIKSLNPETLIIVKREGEEADCPRFTAVESEGMVYSENWFDTKLLSTKKYTPITSFFGYDAEKKSVIISPKSIDKSFSRQVKKIRRRGFKFLSLAPTIIGETGIPFDLNEKEAFKTGVFLMQLRALNRTLKPLEENFLSYMIWHYNAHNTNISGDDWNREDFSVYSADQEEAASYSSGGRALEAVIRPYARKTAGEPLYIHFDPENKIFKYAFQHSKDITAPTVFYIPHFHYPDGYEVMVSDGRYDIDIQEQTLTYYHSEEVNVHKIIVAESESFE